MSNLIDLWAESGASFIGDDAQPALTITNSSTGAGIQTNRLNVSSSATIATLTTTDMVLSNVTVSQLRVAQAIPAANATVIGFSLQGASRASGAVLAFTGDGLVSAVSIVFAASGNWAGLRAARVVLNNGQFGWIPVLPDAVVTTAAVA